MSYSIPTKNNGIAFLLGAVFGIVGFNGVGHIYIGKVLRGILIMILGWVLYAMLIGLFFILSTTYTDNPYTITDESSNYYGLVFILSIIAFIYWLAQALDANRLAKKYNENLLDKNKPLW